MAPERGTGTTSARIAEILRRAAERIERYPEAIGRLLSAMERELESLDENGCAGDPSPSEGEEPAASAAPPAPPAPTGPSRIEPRPTSPALGQEDLRRLLHGTSNAPTRADPRAVPFDQPRGELDHFIDEIRSIEQDARSMELLLQGVRGGVRFGRSAATGGFETLERALESNDPALSRRVAREVARLTAAGVRRWPLSIAREPAAGSLVAAERAFAALRRAMRLVRAELELVRRSGRGPRQLGIDARAAMKEVMELAAEAQCMVKSAATELVGPLSRGSVYDAHGHCDIQERAFRIIREIVHETRFAMRIERYLSAAASRDPRDAPKLQRRLQRLEARRRIRDEPADAEVELIAELDDSEEAVVAGPPQRFESVGEAVAEAERLFGEGPDAPLRFLDSAHDTAADSPYVRPDELFELLSALADATTAWRRANGALGRPFADLLRERGFGEKLISQTASTRWRSEYTFVVGDRRVLFEQHWTLGSRGPNTCISVHWYRDPESRRTLVGHCGRHLTNTKT